MFQSACGQRNDITNLIMAYTVRLRKMKTNMAAVQVTNGPSTGRVTIAQMPPPKETNKVKSEKVN